MIQVRLLRLLDVTPSHPGERPFVAGASGLCEAAGQLFVVGDEEHTLAAFSAGTSAPGIRHLLLRPEAQDHAPLPKALKPDLEALCLLPGGSLLALPSGSSPARRVGAVVRLENGAPLLPARVIDFGPLLDRLAGETDSLNLEGAVVIGQRLWLAQRGNKASPSALFEVDLRALEADEIPAAAFRRAVSLKLGECDGVPFTPTDLCPLPDGRLVISAVCEDTSDSYHDGRCLAAGVAIVEPGQAPERILRLDPLYKVEGVICRPTSSGLALWMVADADDPTRPSPLLEGKLR